MPPRRRFLDQFQVILLDMNGTFMFGGDRFGEFEDFFSTYRALGGDRLDRASVHRAIQSCYAGMMRDYRDPSMIDDFPSLAEGLRRYANVKEADVPLLEAVFARHEVGRIPREYAACLERLSRSHQLGLAANIWARKGPWLAEFERAGVADLWHTAVFSSDGRSVKPSPQLFREAMGAFDVPLSQVVCVGDSLRCDIAGAKSFGLGTVWITTGVSGHPLADRVIPSLLALETLPAP
jgi:putative hydrolase of the HAD superfamily